MEKRRVAILGSTGSIGRQTLDVISQHSDMFEVELLTANNSSGLLIEQAIKFNANSVVISNGEKYREVAQALEPHYIKVFTGMQSICDLVAGDNIDIVVTAMVGFSGLESTVAAIRAGKTIALANKETLVAAGAIVMDLAARHNAAILPVDSEHSAIFQCLQGSHGAGIEKIHLTASGGPFREWKREDIAKATMEQALKHPKWNMGSKITIDSATMMNKGLEIIEARWLFGVSPDKINVVVHPQSIIHSMVEFADGAVIAQLGHPDMREPIQYAIAYPGRLPLNNRKLDFAELASLSFFAPDMDKFPAIGLAYKALEKGGNMPCIMNAANEAAVAAYLKGMIGFYDITDIIAECMAGADFVASPTLDDIFSTNGAVLEMAAGIIDRTASEKIF
ncbi:MAG: 1-deoxy-D-xylulose-5-phosphate reductoisomerase [Bacteroidales bacterium]|nr:1-deoxy-D-xylulose-5-phosphate reductoisomerase [Bacteroides sp.]MCM1199023.1 1-deoxy-D-xylulose-5-phosphate reductoisomerase [Clostridium sp.]MCM1502421.1 1-deoxy-D-xylulose-5-phosphate reductoisomerase [Bacteroidales bacterium]